MQANESKSLTTIQIIDSRCWFRYFLLDGN